MYVANSIVKLKMVHKIQSNHFAKINTYHILILTAHKTQNTKQPLICLINFKMNALNMRNVYFGVCALRTFMWFGKIAASISCVWNHQLHQSIHWITHICVMMDQLLKWIFLQLNNKPVFIAYCLCVSSTIFSLRFYLEVSINRL